MAQEYIFRGERKPYAPDPDDQRAREQAKREAEQLVNRKPLQASAEPSADAEVERKVGDYQVGGLDSFGADPAQPRSQEDSADEQEKNT